jgi:hypothetical protein
MATAIKLRWEGACPKHPRYNPENGPGAIRAGCQFCLRLLQLRRDADKLERDARTFLNDRADFKSKLSAQKRARQPATTAGDVVAWEVKE